MRPAPVVLVIALAFASALTAHADPPGDRAQAERFFKVGAKAFAAQSYETAAGQFEQAYKALPLPEIAFSAAQAYRRAYRVNARPQYVTRAVELYKKYLADVKTGGRVGDAADGLGEMERELDRLKLTGSAIGATGDRGDRTQLGISINVADQAADAGALREIGDATHDIAPGAVATIDGKQVAPFALFDVDAREHVIAVHADGYFPVEKKALAVAGQAQLVEVELKPMPAKLVVRAAGDARIAIDGRPAGAAPGTAIDVAAGKHLITVVRDGYEPFGRDATLARGQQLALDAPMEKTPRRRAVRWVIAGAGVLAAGAIATGIAAEVYDGRASDVHAQIMAGNRPPSDADRFDSDVSSRDNYVTATWVLGGAAVATAAIGAALYYFDHASPEGVRITPVVAPGSAGAALSGRF